MVLFLVIVFYLSLLGMAAILLLKWWELTHQTVVAIPVRGAIARSVHTASLWGRSLPSFLQVYTRYIGVHLKVALRHAAVAAILKTERTLERTLHAIRQKTEPPHTDAPTSSFLREVSEHKKTVLRRTRRTHIPREDPPR